jgi:hypothetical protein
MKKILTIIILFLSTTTLNANDRDVELDKLFLELKKIFHLYHLELLSKSGCCGAHILQIKN